MSQVGVQPLTDGILATNQPGSSYRCEDGVTAAAVEEVQLGRVHEEADSLVLLQPNVRGDPRDVEVASDIYARVRIGAEMLDQVDDAAKQPRLGAVIRRDGEVL
jgi:hypothetical protein